MLKSDPKEMGRDKGIERPIRWRGKTICFTSMSRVRPAVWVDNRQGVERVEVASAPRSRGRNDV